ncbi:MAG TPA: sugar phosphate isomerase/epimerase [Actinobacteria bacterium]|nr:sugar phosphate isomerase/epimerase [Actinomycetota bacterium]
MKFSYCSIAFRNQDMALGQMILLLAKAGYQGIELWGNHVNKETDLKALRFLLDSHGLEVPMISPYFDFTASVAKWDKSIETASTYIKIASFLKAPLIRAFTGTVGSKKATVEQVQRCVEGLKKICAEASEEGISIALETHPSTLVDNVSSTLHLLEKVEADNLKVNLDIYHMFEVHKDPQFVLERLYEHVAHIHAKNAVIKPELREQAKHPLLHDPNPRADFVGVTSLADGEMEYKPFIKALQDRKYSGYVSIEWFGKDPAIAAQSEIQYLRKLSKIRRVVTERVTTL